MSAHFAKFVAYFRVLTDRQGKSGLGLDAQREAVMSYLNGGSWTLVSEFTEVESGKRSDNRPQLAAAIAACKKQRAKLVIAKLDRLRPQPGFHRGADGKRCRVRCRRYAACESVDGAHLGRRRRARAPDDLGANQGRPTGRQEAREGFRQPGHSQFVLATAAEMRSTLRVTTAVLHW
jgi:hypothetical protein